MSRRTAESNKAILAAWNKEQELVQEGKGTREWTPKQQQDILEKGKAYDDDGVAFQGQHMKSAEMYPEYQGEPGNIRNRMTLLVAASLETIDFTGFFGYYA